MARGGERVQLMSKYRILKARFLMLAEKVNANDALVGAEYDKAMDRIYECEQALKHFRAFINSWEAKDSKNYECMAKEGASLLSIAQEQVEKLLKVCFKPLPDQPEITSF